MNKYLIGNWKMNMERDEAIEFIFNISESVPSSDKLRTVICPPYIYLRSMVKRQGEEVRIGAQNMHFEESGAYTGEISPKMLDSMSVEYVIIGHSERRMYFGETDLTVNKKVKAAIAHNIQPILCVGEPESERVADTFKEYIKEQVVAAFEGLSSADAAKVVVAYEPIWAIGTGRTATAEQAEETCEYIRSVISGLYSAITASEVSILYGGSVSLDTVDTLFAKNNIDGFLVGKASLDSKSFIDMANKMVK